MEVAAAAAGRMGRRRREGPGNARGGRGLERESGSGAVRARGGPQRRRRTVGLGSQHVTFIRFEDIWG